MNFPILSERVLQELYHMNREEGVKFLMGVLMQVWKEATEEAYRDKQETRH